MLAAVPVKSRNLSVFWLATPSITQKQVVQKARTRSREFIVDWIGLSRVHNKHFKYNFSSSGERETVKNAAHDGNRSELLGETLTFRLHAGM